MKMDKEHKEIFDRIDPLNFEKTRYYLDINLCMIHDPVVKKALCNAISGHYRHLAQIDGIRENALEEADYFFKKAESINLKNKLNLQSKAQT